MPGNVVNQTCTDGSHLTLIYGAGKVTLDGRETLLAEDATNTRYSWPADGTHQVWTLSGEIGSLALNDGVKGTETGVKTGCKPDGLAN